eukprot:COSAG01_NODE_4076_length_5380_cov_5.943950_5_plen_129_part_00
MGVWAQVAILQQYCEDKVSDAQFKAAQEKFKHINPPQSKVCTHARMCRHHCTRTTLSFSRAAFCAVRPQEEAYYRLVFDAHYPGQEKFVNVWEGGCRAGGVSRAFPVHLVRGPFGLRFTYVRLFLSRN